MPILIEQHWLDTPFIIFHHCSLEVLEPLLVQLLPGLSLDAPAIPIVINLLLNYCAIAIFFPFFNIREILVVTEFI